MERRRIHEVVTHIPALLVVLLLLGATPLPTPEEAYRAGCDAADRKEWNTAEQIVNDALGRFSSAPATSLWPLKVLYGQVLCGRGKFEDAQAVLQQPPPASLRQSEAEVRRLLWLAVVQGRLNRPQVEPLLERARALAAKHHPRQLATVYNVGASVGDDSKRVDRARQAYRLARRDGNVMVQIGAINEIFRSLTHARRYDEAIRWGEKALTLAPPRGADAMIQKIKGGLGWAYHELGDAELASEYFESAIALARKSGATNDVIPWANELASILLDRGDVEGAERTYQDALMMGRQTHSPELPAILNNLAALAIEQKQFPLARRYLADAMVEEKKADGADESKAATRMCEGRIAVGEQRYADAQAIFEELLPNPKFGSEAETRLADLFVRTNRLTEAEAHYNGAIERIGTMRGSLSEELRLPFGSRVKDPFDAYLTFLVDHGRTDDALQLTETFRGQTLEEGLQIARSQKPVDARAIARAHGATILCYWLGGERSYVWTITPAAITFAPIPRSQFALESLVNSYKRELLGARPTSAITSARGKELWDLLVAPAVRGGLAPDARVITVTDGPLGGLNFETLVASKPRPHYWIEDVVTSSSNSLQMLERASALRAGPGKMLLVGNAPSNDPAFPPLENAAAEIEKVKRHFLRRTVLEGAKATPAGYRAAAPETFDFIHFVAHAVGMTTHPLDSAVILARDASGSDRLYAKSLDEKRLKARLVTISSCHGAGSRTYAGEGVVGLAWAFQRAGAARVIAALWEVSDKAAPDLMDRMYASIAAGKDPADALREAKLQLVRSNGVYNRPRYWAPFVLYLGS